MMWGHPPKEPGHADQRPHHMVDGSTSGAKIALQLCAILLITAQPLSLRAQQSLPWPRVRQADLLPLTSDAAGIPAPRSPALVRIPLGSLYQAENDLAAGMRMEDQRQEGCVDLYYRAALAAWRNLEGVSCRSAAKQYDRTAWQTYQQSLARLVNAASRFGRLDPRAHLIVNDNHGQRFIPTVYRGFAWKPAEFCQVVPASEFQGSGPRRRYRTPGLGISLVAMRRACSEEQFHRLTQPFAATALLRALPNADRPAINPDVAAETCGPEAVLEFCNPHVFELVSLGPARVPLQRDLSAPFAYVSEERPRLNLMGFFDPAETGVEPRLFMIEPYQPGKIPVVFIHGLLSDPMTWLDAVNDLRAHPDLYREYQFWYFRYPTGGELLESAAKLREQLLLARATFDPGCRDEAMARMVLVGHSMGGLIARLQVVYSYEILWRHAARKPLSAVRATPTVRERLERDFFFDPSPLVSRVVFIGTPHRGASMARRLTAQLASGLVRPFGSEEPLYRGLMDQNRDVFYEYLWKSPPTSIDLLEPENPLLKAMAKMPFRRGVRLHSILGTGGTMLLGEPGDGVVPVSSARQEGVVSELFVPARHTQLHHDDATVAELRRILREHSLESGN